MAANVLDNLANWSTTDSSNQPDGSDAADIDAELRRIQSVVRKYTRTIGANIASASTVDLSAATGDVITVTGTTTITGLGTVSAGMRFWLVFSGVLTLTHNGTSLILPGAANITTVAGDVACFESLGSGNWRCLAYTKNTTPTVYASTGANLDITSLSGLTTPLSIAQGGTGADNLDALAKESSTQTIWIPAGAMTPRTTNGATVGTVETATNNVMVKTLDFSGTIGQGAQFYIRMPKGWDEGTITYTPVWSHGTATAYGVTWGLRAFSLGDGEALDGTWGTGVGVTDTGGTTDRIYIGPASAALTIAGSPAYGDVCVFDMYRYPSDAGDTMTETARLHGITINYTTTSLNDA